MCLVSHSPGKTSYLKTDILNNSKSAHTSKLFLGGRVIENNAMLKPVDEDDKIGYFKYMGSYENNTQNGKFTNLQSYLNKFKNGANSHDNSMKIEDDSFNRGDGCLRNNDIAGSSPSKFKRNRRLFIDRSAIKSVLGQSPGKYHGFAQDYMNGGTYSNDSGPNIIISDIRGYAKKKLNDKYSKSSESLNSNASVRKYASYNQDAISNVLAQKGNSD